MLAPKPFIPEFPASKSQHVASDEAQHEASQHAAVSGCPGLESAAVARVCVSLNAEESVSSMRAHGRGGIDCGPVLQMQPSTLNVTLSVRKGPQPEGLCFQ